MAAAGPQAGAAADHLPEMTATDEGEPATCSALRVHSENVLRMSCSTQSFDRAEDWDDNVVQPSACPIWGCLLLMLIDSVTVVNALSQAAVSLQLSDS